MLQLKHAHSLPPHAPSRGNNSPNVSQRIGPQSPSTFPEAISSNHSVPLEQWFSKSGLYQNHLGSEPRTPDPDPCKPEFGKHRSQLLCRQKPIGYKRERKFLSRITCLPFPVPLPTKDLKNTHAPLQPTLPTFLPYAPLCYQPHPTASPLYFLEATRLFPDPSHRPLPGARDGLLGDRENTSHVQGRRRLFLGEPEPTPPET